MTLLITDGFPRNLGYAEIDQRNVGAPLPPGVPRHFESDTYTCSHCQHVVVRLALFDKTKREPPKCGGCNHHICEGCATKKRNGVPCKTWAQHIDELAERDARQLDAPSIILQ